MISAEDDASDAAPAQPSKNWGVSPVETYATGHAKQRFLERYGGEMSGDDVHSILGDVRAGRGMLMSRDHPHSERWMVLLDGVAVHVVVDGRQTRIITVLPVGARKRRFFTKAGSRIERGDWL